MKHYNRKTLISAAMIFLLISFSSYMSLVIFALYINSKAGILLTSVIVALPNMIRFFSGLLTPKIERMLGKKQSLFLAVCIMAVCYIFYVVFKEWKGLLLAGILNGLAELLYQPRKVNPQIIININFNFVLESISSCFEFVLF